MCRLSPPKWFCARDWGQTDLWPSEQPCAQVGHGTHPKNKPCAALQSLKDEFKMNHTNWGTDGKSSLTCNLLRSLLSCQVSNQISVLAVRTGRADATQHHNLLAITLVWSLDQSTVHVHSQSFWDSKSSIKWFLEPDGYFISWYGPFTDISETISMFSKYVHDMKTFFRSCDAENHSFIINLFLI